MRFLIFFVLAFLFIGVHSSEYDFEYESEEISTSTIKQKKSQDESKETSEVVTDDETENTTSKNEEDEITDLNMKPNKQDNKTPKQEEKGKGKETMKIAKKEKGEISKIGEDGEEIENDEIKELDEPKLIDSMHKEDKDENESGADESIEYNEDYDYDEDDEEEDEWEQMMNEAMNKLFPPNLERKPIKVVKVVPHINDTIRILKRLGNLLKEVMGPLMKRLQPRLMNVIYETDLSTECMQSILRLVSQGQSGGVWALKFLDSVGRIPPALNDGTVTDFGEYEECLDIESPPDPEKPFVQGKYCMAMRALPLPPKPEHFRYKKPAISADQPGVNKTELWEHFVKHFNLYYYVKGIRTGICFPHLCTPREIEDVLKNMGSKKNKNLPFKIGPTCDVKGEEVEETDFRRVAKIALYVAAGIVLFASLYEVYSRITDVEIKFGEEKPKPNALHNIIVAFSAVKNTGKIFDDSGDIAVADGARAIALMWVFVGQLYYWYMGPAGFVMKRITGNVMLKMTSLRYLPIRNFFFQYETLFLISGCLISYSILKTLKSGGRFNYFVYLINRWLRYTPLVAVTVLSYQLLPHFGSGPIFKDNIYPIVKACEDNWWPNLLFTNNILLQERSEECAGQTWFLSTDIQLYVFAPLFVFLLHKNEMLGILSCLIAIAAGCFLSVLPYFLNGKLPDIGIDQLLRGDWRTGMDHDYFAYPYHHIAPFVLGILLGYLILKYKDIELHQYLWAFLWIALPGISFFSFVYNLYWMDIDEDYEPTKKQLIIYLALYKLAWVIGWAWIIFACHAGKGGYFGAFLGLTFFTSISRLQIPIYCLMYWMTLLRAFAVKYTVPFSDYRILSIAMLNFIITFFMAYCLYLMFVLPLINLSKFIFESEISHSFAMNGALQGGKTNNIRLKHIDINSNEINDRNPITDALKKDNLEKKSHKF